MMVLSTVFPVIPEVSLAIENSEIKAVQGENTEKFIIEQDKNSIEDEIVEISDLKFNAKTGKITGMKDAGDKYDGKNLKIEVPAEIKGKAVTGIEPLAFYDRKDIKAADFRNAENLKEIGDYAFAFSGIENIDLSKADNLEMIKSYAFFGTPAEEIALPESESLRKIEKSAFGNHKLSFEEIDEYLTVYEKDRPELETEEALTEMNLEDEELQRALELELSEFEKNMRQNKQREESLKRESEKEDNNNRETEQKDTEKEDRSSDYEEMERKKQDFINELSINDITAAPIGLRLMNAPIAMMNTGNAEDEWTVSPEVPINGNSMNIQNVSVVKDSSGYLKWTIDAIHTGPYSGDKYWYLYVSSENLRIESVVSSKDELIEVSGGYRHRNKKVGSNEEMEFTIFTSDPETDSVSLSVEISRTTANGNIHSRTTVNTVLTAERPVPPEPEPEDWNFTVVDSETQEAVEGAEIIIDEAGSATTDSTGRAAINSIYEDNKRYFITVNKDGYYPYDSELIFYPENTDITIELDRIPADKVMNIKVRGNDGLPAEGVQVSVTDDSGEVLTGTTSAEGTVQLIGRFTDGKSYSAELTVPEGYFQPEDSVKVMYSGKTDNPDESEMNKVTVDKTDIYPGNLNITTNVSDTDIVLKIYNGQTADKTSFIREVSIPAGESAKVENLNENSIYTVKIDSVSNAEYSGNTGSETVFVYNYSKPNLKIYLDKDSQENTFEIRIHENGNLGPLTDKLERRKITIKPKDGTENIEAVIFEGKAVFHNISGVYEIVKTPSLEGYKIINQGKEIDIQSSGYQDWSLVKSSSKVFLNATAPVGENFPGDMTVSIQDSRGNIIGEVKNIGNGQVVFEDVPQGETYNIIYSNVPANWTHSGNMMEKFTVAEDEIAVTVNDSFGYDNPDADISEFAVLVVDNYNSPVQGYEFQLFRTDDSSNPVATINTDASGSAKTELPKLSPGQYRVVNTKSKEGYNKVVFNDIVITEEDYNIKLDASVSRSAGNLTNVNLTLVSETGEKIPYEYLEFYENDALMPGDYQTDQNGKTYIHGISYNQASQYYVKLKNGSMYEFTDGSDSRLLNIEEGAENNITAEVKVKSEYGRININALTDEGKSVSGVLFQIFSENSSEPIKFISTDSNGNYMSEYLPEGNYTVKIVPSDRYSVVGESEKNVQISSENENNIVTAAFTLEENYITVENGGSVSVEGSMINMESDWTVTIVKNASEDGQTLRAPINMIRFSEKELINPNQLKLIVEENGVQTEKDINGHFTKVDGYYELIDDRTFEKSSGEVKYIYTFKAQGLKNPPKTLNPENPDDTEMKSGYTVYAGTKIMSDNPKETVPRISAAKKLMSVGHNVVMNAQGIGYTFRDFTQKWTYNIEARSDVSYGDMIFSVSIPEDELQKGIRNITLYPRKEDGTPDKNNPYKDVIFNISEDKKTASFKVPDVGPDLKGYILEIEGDAKTDSFPSGNYEQEASLEFKIDDITIDKKDFTAEAPSINSLPPVYKSEVKGCGDDRKFNIYMEGYITNDRKNIQWIIKATNISSSNGSWPVNMELTPGAGLGNIEGLSMISEGQMFPYITQDSFDPESENLKDTVKVQVGQGVYDIYNSMGLDHKNELTEDNIADMMKYMPYTLRDVNINNNLIQRHTFQKTSVTGTTSNLHKEDWGAKERDEVKIVRPGEFVEMSFSTPITDLSQVKNGYTMNFNIDMVGSGCGKLEESLSIQRENFQNKFIGCHLKNNNGDVRLLGKLNSTGDAVVWTAEVQSYNGGNIDLDFNFTDDEGNYQKLSKLGMMQPGDSDKKGKLNGNEITDMNILSFKQSVTGSVPRYELNIDNPDRGGIYVFEMTMPIDETNTDISQYNLKVSGMIGGSNIGECISKVEGIYTSIEIQKWWTNILKGQSLPRAEFEIIRYDELGKSEVLDKKSVFEAEDLKDPDSTYTIPPEGLFYAQKINKISGLRNYDENGNKYRYAIKEKEVDGYESFIYVYSQEKNQFIAENRRINKFEQQQDPTEYITTDSGQYPEDFRQDGPDIRNSYTHLDDTELNTEKVPKGQDKGEPYKIDYPDAKIGKSGQQTDIPGEFDMDLTVEGKGSGYESGVDVVFVLDNSASMSKSMNEYVQGAEDDQLYKYIRPTNEEFRSKYEDEIRAGIGKWQDFSKYRQKYIYNNSKMVALREYTEYAVDNLLNLNDESNSSKVRIGLVNYATDVDPIKASQEMAQLPDPYNRQMDYYYRKAKAVNGELMNFVYSTPYANLSSDKADIEDALPKAYRSNDGSGSGSGDYLLSSDIDGQTNIQAGVRKGMEVLYGGDGNLNDGRKKVLVVISDGAPSAHYDLRNASNIENSNSSSIFSTGKYHIGKGIQYDFNGVRITDHGIPALMEKDYWMERYSSNAPEIITMSINLGQVNDGASVEEQNEFLRNLSTGENGENAHSVKLPRQFIESMQAIENKIITMNTKTINNGIVRDPMGEMVNIKDINGDGLITLASSRELLDGDVCIEDNRGTHLDSEERILNSENQPVSDGNTLLEDIAVSGITDSEGKMGFEVSGLNLGDDDEIRIHYRINIDTEKEGYYAGTYYQANKTTTLEPRFKPEELEEDKIFRYFPIPSVKGPEQKISLEKIWKDSTGKPLSDVELSALENLGAVFKLERYKADRPYNAANAEETEFKKDLSFSPIYLILNQKNDYEAQIENLLAYDSTGHEYRYKFNELELPDWEFEGKVNKVNGKKVNNYRMVYSKEEGTRFIGETGSILNPEEEGNLTVEYSNKKKETIEPNIPNSGGRGTILFTVLGTMFLAAGSLFQFFRNREKTVK